MVFTSIYIVVHTIIFLSSLSSWDCKWDPLPLKYTDAESPVVILGKQSVVLVIYKNSKINSHASQVGVHISQDLFHTQFIISIKGMAQITQLHILLIALSFF